MAGHAATHYFWGNIGLSLSTYALIVLGILWPLRVRRYSKRIAQTVVFGVVPISLWVVQFEFYQREAVSWLYTVNAICLTVLAIGRVIYHAVRRRFSLRIAIFWTIFGLSLLLQYFSYLYWTIGSEPSFNHPLTHLDALYFAVGTFTTAGTGKFVANSEAAIRLQTVQMGLDFLFVAVALALLLTRFSLYMAERINHSGQEKVSP